MIVIALFFFFAALSLFVSATLIVELALPISVGVVFKLGSLLLLSALLLLFLTGLLLMAKAIIRSCRRFFASDQRIRRRWLYIQGEQIRIDRLLYFRKQHIRYVQGQRLKRLEQANERKHIHSLAEAVHNDLLAQKNHLPALVFKELQQEHACYRTNRDSAALMMLQRKIADLA